MSIKMSVKSILATFIHTSGGIKFWRNFRQNNETFVLMYHRIIENVELEKTTVQPGMFVTKSTFRSQMNFLKSQFHVLPVDELVERIETGRSVENCCAITFDDGWHDNYTLGFSVLKEFRLPATIFMATGFIGTHRLFWPEELSFYLKQQQISHPNNAVIQLIEKLPERCADVDRLEFAIKIMKSKSPQAREKIMASLRESCPTYPGRLLMNWQEAKEMLDSGLIHFGAHTEQHVILDQIPLAQARQEIIRSRRTLENRLGTSPTLFAYPNGNYTAELPTLLKQNGFKAAVTTRKGWFEKNVSLYEIPRIGIHEDVSRTIPLFSARILLDRF